MSKELISKIIFVGTLSITVVTVIRIVILFFLGDYSLSLFIEDAFFCILMVLFLWILPRLERHYAIRLPFNLRVQLYLFALGLLIVGNVYDLIGATLWFDKLLHFMSGSFLASIGMIFASKWIPASPIRIKSYVAFLYSATISLVWEIIEFVGDIVLILVYPSYEYTMQFYHVEHKLWVLRQPYALVDTMLDVILGVLGALLFLFIYRRVHHESKDHTISDESNNQSKI